MEAEETVPVPQKTTPDVKEEIKSFYQKDVMGIIKKVLLEPVNGTYSLFSDRTEKSFNQSLILMASAVLISMIFTVISIPSEIREQIKWSSIMFKAAFFTIVFLFLVSLISFGIKMISGKASFKNELLTGALCAIPYTVLVVLLFLTSKIMLNETVIGNLMYGDYTDIISKAGIFLVFIFYVILLFINVLLQSLRSSGTKDAIAWYLSPLGIFLAFYITFKIVI